VREARPSDGLLAAVARVVTAARRSVVLASLVLALGALGCGAGDPASPIEAEQSAQAAQRIVSINPSLTAILLALGAGETIVGVDEFSAVQQPAVADRPRVGGLFNPSLEAVAALQPDAVVVVPSVEQRDFVARLREMGVRVVVCENIELGQVLANIAELGALTGRSEVAASRIRAIERARDTARSLTGESPRRRALMVLQREPVFVVGSGGFIDELLEVAGADNLAASFGEPYPQVAMEWLVDVGPEVLIDMSDEPGDPLDYWRRWPAIPAVASGRVLHLEPATVTLPGPHLDVAIAELVAALHGPEAAEALRLALAAADESEG